MPEVPNARGILYPAKLPTFHRVPASEAMQSRIRWFWMPRWELEPGRTSRQEVLAFPVSNLVVMPQGLVLSGPATRASHRDLRGHGWAVGALLRPAALAVLHDDPGSLRDAEIAFDAPALHRAISSAMELADRDRGREAAAAAFTEWAEERLRDLDDGGLLANSMEDMVASDPAILRVEQLAQRLHISVRAVQRLARRYVGLPPLAMIRRYRLQEAAHRLRDDPTVTVAQIASDLGYVDQAHLATDFRRVIGVQPNTYRRANTVSTGLE